jgi:hypothetical protein
MKLMCTGIRDDNSKLLYVGDKVLIGNYFDESIDEGIIEYDDISRDLVINGKCKTWNGNTKFTLSVCGHLRGRYTIIKI